MRREWAFQGSSAPGFSLHLKRNCSISPLGLARAFALIAAFTLGIAAAWAYVGAWLVLPFAGLEVAALALAFLACGRHAADYERIELRGARLTVEVADAQHRIRRRAARLSPSPVRTEKSSMAPETLSARALTILIAG